MKRVYMVFLAAVLMALTVMPAAAQDEGDFNFTLDNTFVNRYLWRGFLVNTS